MISTLNKAMVPRGGTAPHATQWIEPDLQNASPKNGSFLGIGWRFSGVFGPEILDPHKWRPGVS
jgi:hypothetical protein